MEPGRDVATASFAYAVVAADMDRDGDLDLVSAAYSANQIAWYENDGDPAVSGWTPHVISSTTDGPVSVFVADVDGDGDPDVLCAAYNTDDVIWFESDGSPGDGGWIPRFIDESLDGAFSVCAADVDRDGDVDVIAAANTGAFALYENIGGPPGWTKRLITAGGGPVSVTVGDVDGDGDLDLVGAKQTVASVIWYENDGTWNVSFWAARTLDAALSGAQSVDTGDIDGDGHLDVIAAGSSANSVVWYQSDGTPPDGGWTKQVIDFALAGACAVRAADLDADGDLDVVAAGQTAGVVEWYENDGGALPSWTPRVIGPNAAGAVSVFPADLDGDGDLDVAAACSGSNKFVWYRNVTLHRSASFSAPHPVDPSLSSVPASLAADLDGDGDLDIVSADFDLNSVSWQENTAGDGSSWTTRLIAGGLSEPMSVDVADLDGDGDLDVLCAVFSAHDVLWFENDGTPQDGGWTLRSIDVNLDGAVAVRAGDIDRDGDQDVLAAAINAHQLTLYENDGAHPPAWMKRMLPLVDGAVSVALADLDSDGDLDPIGANRAANSVVWYANDGTWNVANWTLRTIDGALAGARSVSVADVDHDGDLDVLAAAENSDAVVWYRNSWSPSDPWEKRVIDPALNGAVAVAAGDLDADGDEDLLAAGSSAGVIRWYESDGDSPPSFVLHSLAPGLANAACVSAADLDGDGDLDVLGSSVGAAEPLVWHTNQGGQFALSTVSTAPAVILDGGTDDVLQITSLHRGRPGDGDLELTTFDLLFEKAPGSPMTSSEANGLIENLHVYGDDGSGVFESGLDPLVATIPALSLIDGHQVVSFTDADPAVQVAQGGMGKNFFVVTQLTTNASSLEPDAFAVTHATSSSSTAEDRSYDVPLTLEFTPDASSAFVQPVNTTTVEEARPAFGLWLVSATPSTGRIEFEFALPEPGPVRLSVFDVAGREVGRIVDAFRPEGRHRAEWRGPGGASGVLFAQYEAAGRVVVRRVVVVK